MENITLELLYHVKDNSSSRFIVESELERFILAKIPDMSACREVPESFFPYYVFTAARRFLFFLDIHRTRRLNIKRLAHSAVMEELLFLQRISNQHLDKMDDKFVIEQVQYQEYTRIVLCIFLHRLVNRTNIHHIKKCDNKCGCYLCK